MTSSTFLPFQYYYNDTIPEVCLPVQVSFPSNDIFVGSILGDSRPDQVRLVPF